MRIWVHLVTNRLPIERQSTMDRMMWSGMEQLESTKVSNDVSCSLKWMLKCAFVDVINACKEYERLAITN